jgi:aryl-alcohol dehydrogenase-like predicted oxidoreductase
MKYATLGKSGIKVSRLVLGCMSFETRGSTWHFDEAGGRALVQRALEAGINFFDTANTYGDGGSEEVLGAAIADMARREEVVIATKVYFPMREDPNGHGLSRKAILAEVDASLRRLRTEYIDLYQIHRFDYDTPVEETLRALDDLVRSGKVRYVGASSMHAWQFCRALGLADRHGWSRFVSMQNHYNLLNREEEREMLPLCAHEGVGVIPWSPLARGRLTRPWGAPSSSDRVRVDETARKIYAGTEAADARVVASLEIVAAARGLPLAQVALAWLYHKPVVTAPIIGATRLAHLDDALAALDVTLTPEEIATLEADYVPHGVVGYE